MINGNYAGGLVETETVELTTATTTDIFTTENEKQMLAGFCIVNTDSSARDVTLYMQKDGSTDMLFWKKSIPANDTIVEADIPQQLRITPNIYKLRAQVGTANVIHITPIVFTA